MNGRTPREIALQASLLASIFPVVLFLLISLRAKTPSDWWVYMLFYCASALASYIILFQFIDRFLHHRIRLIHKTIHRLKSGPDERRRWRMGEDVLSSVNEEVMEWAESHIKEIRELKEKDTFRKEFIGNLSHELKTPIFSIQGYILTLLEGALEDPENNRKFLLKAEKSVDRVTALLEDLDQITGLEAGSLKLQTSRFDLVELSREVIDSLDEKSRSHGISLKLAAAAHPPIIVLADRVKVAQVLTNLLVNSIIYGRAGGETKIRYFDLDDNILVEVADNGTGISEEHLPRIFERFYRVDKSRSRDLAGSGLGLAIVKHILEAHGQSIDVRSTPDHGSVFSFTLEKS